MNSGPHPFTLRQLQYAVAVADVLSFRRAAERCHVAQPSLSVQVAQLEDGLGVRLFERDKRKVLVTPAGRDLLVRARQLLVEADDLVLAAKGASDPLAGTLRIGVIPTISPYLLPSATPRIRKRFPALSVAWKEDKTKVLTTSLQAGDLDAVLLAVESEIGDVEYEVVAKDPFVLVASARHPLMAVKAPAAPAELRGASVLLLDEGHCFREQALALCSTARARETELRATSLSTLVQMVAGGAGVTVLPALAVPAEIGRSALRARAFASPSPHRTLALAWRRRSPLGPVLRQVAAVLQDAYADAARGPRRSARAGR